MDDFRIKARITKKSLMREYKTQKGSNSILFYSNHKNYNYYLIIVGKLFTIDLLDKDGG
jgi:hypothetical protein